MYFNALCSLRHLGQFEVEIDSLDLTFVEFLKVVYKQVGESESVAEADIGILFPVFQFVAIVDKKKKRSFKIDENKKLNDQE